VHHQQIKEEETKANKDEKKIKTSKKILNFAFPDCITDTPLEYKMDRLISPIHHSIHYYLTTY